MTKIIPARQKESLMERFQYCFRMLHLHGLLSDSELEKVKKRLIRKWNTEALELANGAAGGEAK